MDHGFILVDQQAVTIKGLRLLVLYEAGD